MLEVCIDDAHGLQACLSTKVERIELCSNLSAGGLTPSAGFITLAASKPISVHVLIRARAGDFIFSENEVAMMCDDIAFAIDAGVNGIVIGAANSNGSLNVGALRQLRDIAGQTSTTLHRVIDTINNPLDAVEQAIDLGFSTILSSGGKPKAQDGMRMLGELNHQANGRIEIVAGGGLTPSAVAPIHQQTGISSFHSSCSQSQIANKHSVLPDQNSASIQYTDTGLIKQYQLAIDALSKT